MKNKGKRAYRFIEKTLGKGPSLEAAPNAKYTGDMAWDVVLFAAMTHRTIEAAVTVLRDREVPSPDVIHRRLRQASNEDLVEVPTNMEGKKVNYVGGRHRKKALRGLRDRRGGKCSEGANLPEHEDRNSRTGGGPDRVW